MSTPRPVAAAVTVASVVAHEGRLLLVEERIDGQLVLNQPAGHLDPGETLAQAAVRETLEESGWDIRLDAFIGTYQWTAPNGVAYLRFAFAGSPLRHHPARALDAGIEAAIWLTPAQLQAQASRHRSPLVWQVASDWLQGRRFPLDLVRALP
jgi:8-oxo-dGTP pyrophosphatase MutT (NUDIX family)